MSDSTQSLAHKMDFTADLHGIVRSMKALALSNINQNELAVQSLNAYSRVIEAGLGACFRDFGPINPVFEQRIKSRHQSVTIIVMGSDFGLVGQFNDVIAAYTKQQIDHKSSTLRIFAVGERIEHRLSDLGIKVARLFPTPHAVSSITPLIGELLNAQGIESTSDLSSELHVFFNQPTTGIEYIPTAKKIIPFDLQLRTQWMEIAWPTNALPQIMGSGTSTVSALIREFLFVSLYRACALSLASENASRLAAMQRADQNIDDLMQQLKKEYHNLRQREIDDDIFDIISGYESQK